jgi:outer membrane lipoprotein-sorting protein
VTNRLSLWLILVVLAPIAQATEDTWPLEGQNTTSGTFRQTVMDINGAVAFSSTGRFAALKPHHFRWEIESPDRQLLIATPEAFWQWDKDLDVVVLRDAPEIEDLPISAIWNGTVDDRTSSDEEPGRFGDEVKNLSVRSPDENTIIVRFEDSLGQKTLFEFNLETQRVVTPSAFAITLPDGVDFYDETSRSLGRAGAIE